MKATRFRSGLTAFAAICTALAASIIGIAAAHADDDKEPLDLRPVLAPIQKRSKAPALAAAVYRDGKLIAVGVCGVRSIESKEPAAADDLFPILSCSKPVARLVLARLAQRGAIDFDAPLSKLLDGVSMRDEYQNVTLKDLLAHRAGIQPYTNIGPRMTPFLFQLKGTPREQRAAFTAHVLGEAPAAPPGTRFVYSNAGFCIVAAVAERATGTDWETLVADEVFTPLGLHSATVGGANVVVSGHRRTPNGPRAMRAFPRLAAMVPAGGVCLSISDFAAYASAEADLEAGRPVADLTAKSLSRLPELRPADAAAPSQDGTMTFGGDGQYHAAFAVWPRERVAIAVACNLGESDDLCTEVAGAVRAAVAPDLKPGDTARTGGPSAQGPRYGYQLKVEPDRIEIAGVAPGSIADTSGIKTGDVILKINGTPIASIEESKRVALLKTSPLTLIVDRNGRPVEVHLKK